MKILLLLPLLLGLMSPAIAHNENNGGCSSHCESNYNDNDVSNPNSNRLRGMGES